MTFSRYSEIQITRSKKDKATGLKAILSINIWKFWETRKKQKKASRLQAVQQSNPNLKYSLPAHHEEHVPNMRQERGLDVIREQGHYPLMRKNVDPEGVCV